MRKSTVFSLIANSGGMNPLAREEFCLVRVLPMGKFTSLAIILHEIFTKIILQIMWKFLLGSTSRWGRWWRLLWAHFFLVLNSLFFKVFLLVFFLFLYLLSDFEAIYYWAASIRWWGRMRLIRALDFNFISLEQAMMSLLSLFFVSWRA